jgi:hypothetical protein
MPCRDLTTTFVRFLCFSTTTTTQRHVCGPALPSPDPHYRQGNKLPAPSQYRNRVPIPNMVSWQAILLSWAFPFAHIQYFTVHYMKFYPSDIYCTSLVWLVPVAVLWHTFAISFSITCC